MSTLLIYFFVKSAYAALIISMSTLVLHAYLDN